MRVDTSRTIQSLIEAQQAPEATKVALQVATLKRVLDSQMQDAAELLKALEPKGRILDILV